MGFCEGSQLDLRPVEVCRIESRACALSVLHLAVVVVFVVVGDSLILVGCDWIVRFFLFPFLLT